MINTPAFYGTIYSREREPQIFTSFMFPFRFDEQFKINTMGFGDHGFMFPQQDTDTAGLGALGITGGTLTETIRYPVYNHPWVEEFYVGGLSILSGTLDTVIAYKSHDQPNTDQAQFGALNIVSGTLTVVVSYISYTTRPDEETVQFGNLGITEATLG